MDEMLKKNAKSGVMNEIQRKKDVYREMKKNSTKKQRMNTGDSTMLPRKYLLEL